MTPEYVVVLTTLPADADAPGFARQLVDERLAACVNLLPVMGVDLPVGRPGGAGY